MRLIHLVLRHGLVDGAVPDRTVALTPTRSLFTADTLTITTLYSSTAAAPATVGLPHLVEIQGGVLALIRRSRICTRRSRGSSSNRTGTARSRARTTARSSNTSIPTAKRQTPEQLLRVRHLLLLFCLLLLAPRRQNQIRRPFAHLLHTPSESVGLRTRGAVLVLKLVRPGLDICSTGFERVAVVVDAFVFRAPGFCACTGFLLCRRRSGCRGWRSRGRGRRRAAAPTSTQLLLLLSLQDAFHAAQTLILLPVLNVQLRGSLIGAA